MWISQNVSVDHFLAIVPSYTYIIVYRDILRDDVILLQTFCTDNQIQIVNYPRPVQVNTIIVGNYRTSSLNKNNKIIPIEYVLDC